MQPCLRSLAAIGVAATTWFGCSDKSTRPAANRPPGDDAPAPASDAAESAAPPVGDSPSWKLDEVANLERLGALDERQRELLTKNGFFLAPQSAPRKPGDRLPLQRATHLFHVYERNDYIAFPSLVTADLAIDATHSYFEAVLSEVEETHLVPRLQAALEALLAEAERVRAAAKTPEGREQAARAAAYWGVALHLLVSPAPGDAPDVVAPEPAYVDPDMEAERSEPKPRKPLPPKEVPASVRDDVDRVTGAVQRATGRLPVPIVRADLDLTQMKPRGHYNQNGVLQRYFRAMSWLGMARFEIGGEADDVVGIALLSRSWLGSETGREGMKKVLEVTTFFAGGPDAADLDAAAEQLARAVPGAGRMSADDLVSEESLKAFGAALSSLPPPRVPAEAPAEPPPQVRVMGRRAFEDTVAMKKLIAPLLAIADKNRGAIAPIMGALGSAATLGSDLARDHLLSLADAETRGGLQSGIDAGRALIAGVSADRWKADAYHGTLSALRPLLAPAAPTAPELLRTRAWSLRMLQAFAAGWAELRHDTILYGEQLGAECDAPQPEPPPGWVEPLPEVYGGLAAMVTELDRRLDRAGVPRDTPAPEGNYFYVPIAQKTQIVIELLRKLEALAKKELAGKPLDRDDREFITLIGGRVEWMLISLADTDMLSPRDQDMAVVADVFTHRILGQVVEAGVAHPDLIYGIIPGPEGPVIARGAVMSYRAFLQPQANRLTDEAWRETLARGKEPERPAWLQPIYAAPVPAIALKGQGVHRCAPMSGVSLEL